MKPLQVAVIQGKQFPIQSADPVSSGRQKLVIQVANPISSVREILVILEYRDLNPKQVHFNVDNPFKDCCLIFSLLPFVCLADSQVIKCLGIYFILRGVTLLRLGYMECPDKAWPTIFGHLARG